ncbi:MAG TPA: tRNA (adenosine(37)-N6)-threonylcarbamoyltransferase complex transferase subunit TsaD [Candidatus Paceibacterota bacterium]|nr:tRNA (adenosine(37)-N6)-threonylcarbamoyltransferase complex transferase subunit TsaD [Candidatus Paceibacterota bacterium]HQB57108.1 tRNA (adenosine(37)-N6)-threonylcarbamoyltransferase complex transferase subunit TsaD [Candidatus Paceibacterota bacterium]
MKKIKLLAIETSCDETAIAVFDFEKKQKGEVKFSVLSNHVLSQINIHREFGGVFPALAKREHAKNIVKIFKESLKEAGLYKEKEIKIKESRKKKVKKLLEREAETCEELFDLVSKIKKPDLEAIAVTAGPGLAPALWVGINFAKALAILWKIPVYPVNHMEGHIMSALVSPFSEKEFVIKNISYPVLALLISGGHTEINYFKKNGKYKKLGQTVDDAIGEAFDKVARSLNLPYPGGPEISKIATLARESHLQIEKDFILPRPMLHSHDLNFSFSGLKTAVIHTIQKMKASGKTEEEIKKSISLDFENAVTEILLKKVEKAIKENNIRSLAIGGGVIANTFIRNNFLTFSEKENLSLYLPDKFLTGDNAFMIGLVGMQQILNKKKKTSTKILKANSNWNIENI